MNEWVDCFVYAVQAVMLWNVMPRWIARFARPMLMDRNAEWVAANPDAIAQLERGNWWTRSIQGWGGFTVLVLLAFRLGIQPSFLTPQAMRTPSWEMLMATSNVMMLGGFLLFGYGVLSFFRWQKREIPLGERRQAPLVPRTTDDYVPRWVQYLVYGLMLANLAAGPVASLFWPERIHNVWGNFAMGLVMSVMLFLVGVGCVVRPYNYMDRVMGPGYRRMEVRLTFGLMLTIVGVGLTSVALEISGVESKRYGALMAALYVSITLALCMSVPTAPTGNEQQSRGKHPRQSRKHSVIALLVPLVVPVALLVLQPVPLNA